MCLRDKKDKRTKRVPNSGNLEPRKGRHRTGIKLKRIDGNVLSGSSFLVHAFAPMANTGQRNARMDRSLPVGTGT